jgi:hypothetical protein
MVKNAISHEKSIASFSLSDAIKAIFESSNALPANEANVVNEEDGRHEEEFPVCGGLYPYRHLEVTRIERGIVFCVIVDTERRARRERGNRKAEASRSKAFKKARKLKYDNQF